MLGFLACGGGNAKQEEPAQPSRATSLVYSAPAGTGFRFVAQAGPASDTLVLELWGPQGESGRGVNFGLRVEKSKARFVKANASDEEYAQNEVFDLGNAPRLFKAMRDEDADTETLNVSIAQKGPGNPKALGGPIARVALRLQAGTARDAAIALTLVPDAKLLPVSGIPIPISISVGTLVAK